MPLYDKNTILLQGEPLINYYVYQKDACINFSTEDLGVICYISGSGTILINDNKYEVNSSVAVIPPFSRVLINVNQVAYDLEILILTLQNQILCEYSCFFDKDFDEELFLRTLHINHTYLSYLFQSLAVLVKQYSTNPVINNVFKNRFFEIIQGIHSSIKSQEVTETLQGIRSPNKMRHVLVKIQSKLVSSDKSVGELCEDIGFSKSTLQRHFRQEFGNSIKQWALNKKLDRARSLLRTSSRTVKEVAYVSGFGSSSYFIKSYKKRFGYTPSQDLLCHVSENWNTLQDSGVEINT